jgi:hypothetical protein
MVQCPHTDLGGRLKYKRRSGAFAVVRDRFQRPFSTIHDEKRISGKLKGEKQAC